MTKSDTSSIHKQIEEAVERIEKRLSIPIDWEDNFLKEQFQLIATKSAEDEIEFLKRIKLEVDVNFCDCGERWSETDISDLINERLEALSKKEQQ